MAHNNLVADAGGPAAPPAGGDGGSAPGELVPALIRRAKDIIAGRIDPPELTAPTEVEEYLRQEFGQADPPPTAEAVRRVRDRLSLEARYGGNPVACFTTPTGAVAVLAAGDHEVEALLRGLSGEEGAKVVVADTEPF